jgi:hypothetical protein
MPASSTVTAKDWIAPTAIRNSEDPSRIGGRWSRVLHALERAHQAALEDGARLETIDAEVRRLAHERRIARRGATRFIQPG